MTKKLIFFVFILLFTACSRPLINLSYAKNLVKEYYEEGAYDNAMDEIITDAISKLGGLKVEPNSAIVFDVDETSLSNYPFMKSIGFGSVSDAWNDWTNSGKCIAIPQTKRFYDYAVSKGYKIFFITGRSANFYAITRKNLIQEGYTKIDTLICRPETDHSHEAQKYKSNLRNGLVKGGYKIVANIGDQWSDLEGGNSGLTIKLPNYLYTLD